MSSITATSIRRLIHSLIAREKLSVPVSLSDDHSPPTQRRLSMSRALSSLRKMSLNFTRGSSSSPSSPPSNTNAHKILQTSTSFADPPVSPSFMVDPNRFVALRSYTPPPGAQGHLALKRGERVMVVDDNDPEAFARVPSGFMRACSLGKDRV